MDVPALAVHVDVGRLFFLGPVQLRKPALCDAQPGVLALRGEGELDAQGVALVRLRAVGVVPAEGELARRLYRLDEQADGRMLVGRLVGEGEGAPAAGAQVDLRGVAEPAADPARFG